MKAPRPTFFGWTLFSLWAVWLAGLQGVWASSDVAAWTPELGLVLLFALDPRLERGERRLAVCLLAATRVAFSSEPVLAVFAAYLGVAGLLAWLRRSIEVENFLVRLFLSAGATTACILFWIVCRRIALFEEGISPPAIALPVGSIVATALMIGLALPLVRNLPGARSILGGRA